MKYECQIFLKKSDGVYHMYSKKYLIDEIVKDITEKEKKLVQCPDLFDQLTLNKNLRRLEKELMELANVPERGMYDPFKIETECPLRILPM